MQKKSEYQGKGLPILSWAEDDRPREKLIIKGKAALSDAELLAIIIASGSQELSAVDLAKQLLIKADYNLHLLAKMDQKELQAIKGIGKAKALSIVSAFELGRRRNRLPTIEKVKISSSKDVYNLMRSHLMDEQKEHFWVILLNRANLVLKTHLISSGGVSGTIADPKLIFKAAIDHLASSVILVHNHPSGNKKPSEADIRLTSKLKSSGQALEIQVLDHLIFTDESFYSFADEGLI